MLRTAFKYFSKNISNIHRSSMCDVAVCQFTATNNKSENFEIVKKLVNDAVEKGAKMAFLPEACDFVGRNVKEIMEMAETLNGPTVQLYQNLAEQHGIWLSVGGFHEIQPKYKKISNAHILINDKGKIVSVYRKLHLFDVSIPEKNIELMESKYVEKGEEIVPIVETPAGHMALSICYDLRFPELGIIQRRKGATILTFPSAFTHSTGKAHWETLLKARAIENQCYVIAAAQYGKHNEKRISYGHSMIIDPWGKIIAECCPYNENVDTDQSVAVARINPEVAAKVRREIPVFEHRRQDLYQLSSLNDKNLPILQSDKFMFSYKEIPEPTVFYKTELCYAFTNLRCVVPGHVLVATRRSVARLENCTPDELSDLFQTVVAVQKVMEKHYGASSSTVCCQDGQEAGQTISHVHIHILPRIKGDFESNDDIYEKLASHDKNGVVQDREINEMIDEAQLLRKYFETSIEKQCNSYCDKNN